MRYSTFDPQQAIKGQLTQIEADHWNTTLRLEEAEEALAAQPKAKKTEDADVTSRRDMAEQNVTMLKSAIKEYEARHKRLTAKVKETNNGGT